MDFQYLPFEFSELPVRKTVPILGTDYIIELQYNDVGDFITIAIYTESGDLLWISKLRYGTDANQIVTDEFPAETTLVPADLTDVFSDDPREIEINPENFGTTVRVYIGRKAA